MLLHPLASNVKYTHHAVWCLMLNVACSPRTVMAPIRLPPFKFQFVAHHTRHIIMVPKGEHWQLLRPHSVSVSSKWMSVEHWWNCTNKGKPKYPEKNQSCCHFIHFESGLGMNPSLWGEWVASCHFIHFESGLGMNPSLWGERVASCHFIHFESGLGMNPSLWSERVACCHFIHFESGLGMNPSLWGLYSMTEQIL